MGQPVDELLRTARRPVLVVRREAEHAYRSLIVAVDFTEASRGLIDLGFALNKSAQVELFHAVSTANEGKLRYAEVSDRAIKAYRSECRRYAQDRMFWLTDSYDTRRNRVLSAVGHGDAARQTVVQQQNSGAELIVVGRHPSSRLSDLFFESHREPHSWLLQHRRARGTSQLRAGFQRLRCDATFNGSACGSPGAGWCAKSTAPSQSGRSVWWRIGPQRNCSASDSATGGCETPFAVIRNEICGHRPSGEQQ